MKCLLALLGLFLASAVMAAEPQVLILEEFVDLKSWKPVTFPKIEKHTAYKIEKEGTNSILVARSAGSASGLVHTNTFNVLKYPRMKWRWKIQNVYKKGNVRRKSGDDYPLRLYVVFPYDSARLGIAWRARYALAKKVRGEYPPHSSLNYIWANRKQKKAIYDSPYTSRSKMVLLQMGSERAGKWITEEVDIVADYKRAFGKDPPPEASLAVMSDSDNTGEGGVARIDYIQLYRPPATKR